MANCGLVKWPGEQEVCLNRAIDLNKKTLNYYILSPNINNILLAYFLLYPL